MTSNIPLEQAECAFLGWLLQHPEELMNIQVSAETFTSVLNERVFTAIRELEAQNKLIDVITVDDHLRSTFPEVDENWLPHLGQMVHDSYSQTFFKSSQMVMLNRYREREIKRIAKTLNESLDPDKAIQALMDMDRTETRHTYTMAEAAMAAIEKAEKSAANNGMTGISTGLTLLDKAMGGLQAPDLYVIGARPAMGKTSFILNLMLNHSEPSAFFSTEQPHEQIGLRAISAESSVSARKIRTADFDPLEMERMSAAVAKLTGKKIHIYDKGHLHITELMREARRLKFNHNIQAVYVDYIQRIKASAESRRLEVSEVVTSLKSLARELQIPVIGLAQLNRKVEERAEKRGLMADFLESGVIEQEADVVMTLYRDEVYNEDTKDKGIIETNIIKNRHGPTGTLKFAWLPNTMQVKNLVSAVNF